MIHRPRGTRDFDPDEMDIRRYFETIMRHEARLFGFREIATPIFEHTELFTLRSGPNIVEEIYAFQDKGGRDIALRPELTAPAMRFFVNELSNRSRPLKMFYFGQCFRYERPQSGRFREFFQFGAELIGNPGPDSDAEIIALAASIMRRIGLKDYSIRIGHIGVLRNILAEADVDAETTPLILQRLDKKEYEEARQLMQNAKIDDETINSIIDITNTVGSINVLDKISGDAHEHLLGIFDILQAYGIDNVQIDLGVVRGLDYYTGVVFEIDAPVLGAEKQICGGGSYSLTELFGGEKTFSTGFGIGFDRTLLALEKEGYDAIVHSVDVYVLPIGNNTRHEAHRIAAQLRQAGISTDIDLMGRSMSKSMRYANGINAQHVVIVGEKELAQESIMLRDMDTGEQQLVKKKDIISILKNQ